MFRVLTIALGVLTQTIMVMGTFKVLGFRLELRV